MFAQSFTPAEPRKYGRRRPQVAAVPVLIDAEYDIGTAIELTFDRDIRIDAIDLTRFFIDDAEVTGLRFQGTGLADLVAPNRVQIPLASIGDSLGVGLTFTALIDNGITTPNGTRWPGVRDVALPMG